MHCLFFGVTPGTLTISAATAIRLDGSPVGGLDVRARRARGLVYVPEERLGHGSVGELSLTENTLLSGLRAQAMTRLGFLDRRVAERFARAVVERFAVATTGPAAAARSLSGGNLQKFLIGRELMQTPRVVICGQPTWGVDAGAAVAIHQALFDLADAGAALVVVSQDLDELFLIADRIAVLNGGRLSPPRPLREVTAEAVGSVDGRRAWGAARCCGWSGVAPPRRRCGSPRPWSRSRPASSPAGSCSRSSAMTRSRPSMASSSRR